MDIMPWTALVFQSIPEEIILVTLGLALVGEYPRMKGIVVVGIIGAVFSFYFRRLSLDFGVHTLALIIALALAIRLILRLNFFKGLIASSLGILALGIVESISIPIVSNLTGISVATALHDPWLRVLFPLPDEIVLGLVAYFCRRRHFSLIFGDGLLRSHKRKEKEDEK
ncbi:Uncharacterized [Moorella glycerini]|uniref:Uncharacterized protein n=1 Tax=Neomoorella stamsii TaxID=1266720 RepID=A0A9X7P5U6_9FIRM|nr:MULTISPECIES: hypothetical protein [Moorella]PRR72146.1 hypothetical protein MOST_18560 [Moorella stamsii]CEP69447.1 Uncharacterized [Moorella glycerini]